jgi:hypothetical protein
MPIRIRAPYVVVPEHVVVPEKATWSCQKSFYLDLVPWPPPGGPAESCSKSNLTCWN